MSESRLNIELFKKVRNRIAEIPQSFNQSTYFSRDKSSPCGTVCCIAGETVICNAATVELGVAELQELAANIAQGSIANRAARLLGLLGDGEHYFEVSHTHPARRLFSDSPHENWPEPFRSRWLYAEQDEEPQVAVAYLDHIIETGKVLE